MRRAPHNTMRTHHHGHSHSRRHRTSLASANPITDQTERSIADLDPSDPTQALDEVGGFQIEPLAVDAEGVDLPPSGDRELAAPEDHDSFARSNAGENWIEALEQAATESGPKAEHELDVTDDGDEHTGHRDEDSADATPVTSRHKRVIL
jgi:hypothetical protein